MTLVPAYGRDYKSKAAVLADWTNGKDFRTSDGPYISQAEAVRHGVGSVTIRYSQLRKVCVLTWRKGQWS